MTENDFHDKSFDESTKTKLKLFEKYLIKWLPVALKNRYYNNINICDFFCGPGKDEKGEKGSPLLILKNLKYYAKQILESNKHINILFNDIEENKINDLKQFIENWECNNPKISNKITFKYYNKDFEKLF